MHQHKILLRMLKSQCVTGLQSVEMSLQYIISEMSGRGEKMLKKMKVELRNTLLEHSPIEDVVNLNAD